MGEYKLFLPEEIVANNNSTTRRITAENISSRDSFILMQHKLYGLHGKLSCLEGLPSRNSYSPRSDHPSFNFEENIYNNRNYCSRIFDNYERMPSARQLEIM